MAQAIFAHVLRSLTTEPFRIRFYKGVLAAVFYQTGDVITWNRHVDGGACTLVYRTSDGGFLRRKVML